MAENYPIYGSNMDIPGHKLTISWTIYLIEGYMKTHFNKNIKSQRQIVFVKERSYIQGKPHL